VNQIKTKQARFFEASNFTAGKGSLVGFFESCGAA